MPLLLYSLGAQTLDRLELVAPAIKIENNEDLDNRRQ